MTEKWELNNQKDPKGSKRILCLNDFPLPCFFVTPAVTAGQWHSRCSSCSSNINRTWRPRRPRRRSLGVPGLWQESMGFLAVDRLSEIVWVILLVGVFRTCFTTDLWFMICRGSSLQLELLDWVAECCRTVVEWFFGGVLYPKWRINVCKVGICIIYNTYNMYIYIHTYITISQKYLWYESICMHTHVSITNPTFVTHDLDLSARQEVSEQHRVLHHQEAAHSCQKMTSFGVPAGCGPSKCLNQPIIAVGPAIFARTWAVLLDLAI